MATLPQFQSTDKDFQLMQNSWASKINPVISNPANNSNLLTGIELVIGSNLINHRLGRKLQGWIVVGINGAAQIYDQQADNRSPQLTLILVSDADVTVNLEVF